MITLRDAGSSTSATPATKIAEITAGSGKKLVHWYLHSGQVFATGTQHRIIITYTDDATTTVSSGASSSVSYFGNSSGMVRRVGTGSDTIHQFSAKDVKNIRVETLGTGTGNRFATLSATEVDTTDTKRIASFSNSGTAGTLVAELSADTGKSLVGWTAIAAHTSTTNTRVRLIITYADSTTTTVDTAINASIIFSNAGGAIRVAASAVNLVTAFSDKQVSSIRIETLSTGTGTRYGVISAEQETTGTSTRKIASGSSTSSTEATLVAEIEAASGAYLYAPTIFNGQTSTASTAIRTIVTYEDDTTSTHDTAVASNTFNTGNAGGILRESGSTPNLITTFENKNIKKIRAETLSTGTGTRYAALSALEHIESATRRIFNIS